jgi:hypothetical protein
VVHVCDRQPESAARGVCRNRVGQHGRVQPARYRHEHRVPAQLEPHRRALDLAQHAPHRVAPHA